MTFRWEINMSCKLNIILDIPDEMRKEKWPDNCQGRVRLSNVAFDNLYFLQNLRKSLIVFYWLIFRQRYISIKYNMANINCNSSSHLEYAAINFEAVICTFVDQTISIYLHFAPFDETFQMGNFAFHPSAQYLILVHHLVYARHVRTYL